MKEFRKKDYNQLGKIGTHLQGIRMEMIDRDTPQEYSIWKCYMASTEGTLPYTYDSCDSGITPWHRSDMDDRMNYNNFYINDKLTFRITEGAFHPDGNIDWRVFPMEPMSVIFNLWLSKDWSEIDLDTIQFPVHIDVDYIRFIKLRTKNH